MAAWSPPDHDSISMMRFATSSSFEWLRGAHPTTTHWNQRGEHPAEGFEWLRGAHPPTTGALGEGDARAGARFEWLRGAQPTKSGDRGAGGGDGGQWRKGQQGGQQEGERGC